ncbi:MAG: hypothetical protein LBR55_07040 [Bacteroidales bacterium]|nr:hypothetical protein [Bacteroidales bacterium]
MENSKLGHDYIAVVTLPACEEEGYTTYTCSRGDDEYVADRVDATRHLYVWIVNPENDKERIEICSECGKLSGAEPQPIECEHEFEWVITTPATCETAGEETEICSVCGVYGNTRTIAQLSGAECDNTASTVVDATTIKLYPNPTAGKAYLSTKAHIQVLINMVHCSIPVTVQK